MNQEKTSQIWTQTCGANRHHGLMTLYGIILEEVLAQYGYICPACGFQAMSIVDRS